MNCLTIPRTNNPKPSWMTMIYRWIQDSSHPNHPMPKGPKTRGHFCDRGASSSSGRQTGTAFYGPPLVEDRWDFLLGLDAVLFLSFSFSLFRAFWARFLSRRRATCFPRLVLKSGMLSSSESISSRGIKAGGPSSSDPFSKSFKGPAKSQVSASSLVWKR